MDNRTPNDTNKIISKEHAKLMVEAYNEKVRKITSERISKERGEPVEDAKCVWVSREEIEKLFNDNEDSTGLKIYYAIADDYKGFPNCRPEQKGLHTIILTATKTVDGTKEPCLENSIDMVADENEKDIPGSFTGVYLDDHGLCPPPNGCSIGSLPY